MRSRGRLGIALSVLALAGCGGGEDRSNLTVSAATSLRSAFRDYAKVFEEGRPRYSFGGSDELAAQIRRGVRPDVFAAANVALPARLAAEGRLEKSVVFARNRLVIAVPARSTKVRSIADLSRPGVDLAVGAPGVPVGAYTREVLARLGASRSHRILANVRSSEPDVGGVVGKLSQGAADAGFVYVTDVTASGGRLRAIELPPRLRPRVEYAAAVVKGAKRPRVARAFIRGLLRGRGLAALRRAGFEPPP